jgi:acetyl-CoA carboxylase alpha subunit
MTWAVRNSGMPHPEGYRKAQRLLRQGEKFGRPVICLVDTPAAHAGIAAEERGQSPGRDACAPRRAINTQDSGCLVATL